MSKDLTKYVLVPYEEYQELINKKTPTKGIEVSADEYYSVTGDNIYFKPLIDKNHKNQWLDSDLEVSVRTHNIILSLARGKHKFNKRPIPQWRMRVDPREFYNIFNNINFFGDLIQLKADDLLHLEGFGRKSRNELKEELLRIDGRLRFGSKLPDDIINKLEQLRKEL
jgi:hypothetical protein